MFLSLGGGRSRGGTWPNGSDSSLPRRVAVPPILQHSISTLQWDGLMDRLSEIQHEHAGKGSLWKFAFRTWMVAVVATPLLLQRFLHQEHLRVYAHQLVYFPLVWFAVPLWLWRWRTRLYLHATHRRRLVLQQFCQTSRDTVVFAQEANLRFGTPRLIRDAVPQPWYKIVSSYEGEFRIGPYDAPFSLSPYVSQDAWEVLIDGLQTIDAQNEADRHWRLYYWGGWVLSYMGFLFPLQSRSDLPPMLLQVYHLAWFALWPYLWVKLHHKNRHTGTTAFHQDYHANKRRRGDPLATLLQDFGKANPVLRAVFRQRQTDLDRPEEELPRQCRFVSISPRTLAWRQYVDDRYPANLGEATRILQSTDPSCRCLDLTHCELESPELEELFALVRAAPTVHTLILGEWLLNHYHECLSQFERQKLTQLRRLEFPLAVRDRVDPQLMQLTRALQSNTSLRSVWLRGEDGTYHAPPSGITILLQRNRWLPRSRELVASNLPLGLWPLALEQLLWHNPAAGHASAYTLLRGKTADWCSVH